jgi:hypothetical protein
LKPAADTRAYTPGLSITTWLHVNVDAFPERAGSTAEDIQQQFHQRGSASRSGTWLDVPTAESPSQDAAAMTDPAILPDDRRDSASLAGTKEDPTLTGDAVTSTSKSADDDLDLQSGSDDSEEDVRPAIRRFLRVGDEHLPLYAPDAVALVAVAPNTSSPSPILGGQQPRQDARAGDEGRVVTVRPRSARLHLQLPEAIPAVLPGTSRPVADGLVGGVVLDHRARHHSHYSAYGMVRPSRTSYRRPPPEQDSMRTMVALFGHDSSVAFQRAKTILSILCASFQPPAIGIIAAAMEAPVAQVSQVIREDMLDLVLVSPEDKRSVVTMRPAHKNLLRWLCCEDRRR